MVTLEAVAVSFMCTLKPVIYALINISLYSICLKLSRHNCESESRSKVNGNKIVAMAMAGTQGGGESTTSSSGGEHDCHSLSRVS